MFQEFPEDNKSEDFLNEFRQKISDQSASNMEEKRNELKRSKSVFIGAVSGVVLAGVVGWFVLSPRYSVDNPEEIPVIRRPQTAVKVQPSEPGGMEILNQDKSVYDIVEKKSGNEPVVENLLPPPEEPKLPVIEAQQIPTPTPAPTTIADILPETKTEVVKAVETKAVVEQAQAIVAANDLPEDKVVSIKEVSMEKVSIPEPVKIEPMKAEPAKTAEVVTGAIPAGAWQVQLMSSKNKKSIESSWNGLVKKYAVLKDQPHEIETADLDFDGVFYRLKAGAFKDRAGADSLCRDIKALGGTCIVKKK